MGGLRTSFRGVVPSIFRRRIGGRRQSAGLIRFRLGDSPASKCSYICGLSGNGVRLGSRGRDIQTGIFRGRFRPREMLAGPQLGFSGLLRGSLTIASERFGLRRVIARVAGGSIRSARKFRRVGRGHFCRRDRQLGIIATPTSGLYLLGPSAGVVHAEGNEPKRTMLVGFANLLEVTGHRVRRFLLIQGGVRGSELGRSTGRGV